MILPFSEPKWKQVDRKGRIGSNCKICRSEVVENCCGFQMVPLQFDRTLRRISCRAPMPSGSSRCKQQPEIQSLYPAGSYEVGT